MIICVSISEECFPLNVSINASLKFRCVLGGFLKGTQALGGQRALE